MTFLSGLQDQTSIAVTVTVIIYIELLASGEAGLEYMPHSASLSVLSN